MKIELVSQYPLWWALLCGLVAAALATGLYYKDRKLNEVALWKIRLMALLRFFSLFLIAFLLLGPMVERTSRKVEKPVVIFAQDNSASLLMGTDSAWLKGPYAASVEALQDELSEDYEVAPYTFGQEVKRGLATDYQAHRTDFSQLFRRIASTYSSERVGALIVASDGIYNQGNNPVYAAEELGFPVYTVLLGDTAARKDAVLSDIQTNKIAFRGNKFPVRVFAEAVRMKGQELQVRIKNQNGVVASETFSPEGNEAFREFDFELTAEEPGLQRYVVEIPALQGEDNLRNNSLEFAIEVIEDKQKILLAYHAPHPDVTAIQQALKDRRNYELQTVRTGEPAPQLEDFNMLIAHGLPQNNAGLQLLRTAIDKRIPVLFAAANLAAPRQLAALLPGVAQTGKPMLTERVYPNLEGRFGLFSISAPLETALKDVPPLSVAFEKYRIDGSYQHFVTQNYQGIPTGKPLISFFPGNDDFVKHGLLLGEGIWRWRIYDYVNNQTHENFNQLVNKMVQYLALREARENIVAEHPNVFDENQSVQLEIQVYNASYERVSDAAVDVTLTHTNGQTFAFTPDVTGRGDNALYILNAGELPKGDYSYSISAEIGQQRYQKEGSFTVLPVKFEAISTQAELGLMHQLAAKNGGSLVWAGQIAGLADSLQQNKDITPISYTTTELSNFLHFKAIFFLILLLLTVEWASRKWNGTY